MKQNHFWLLSGAFFVAAVMSLMVETTTPKAEAGPKGFGVAGCPLFGTRTTAAKIFGSYAWSTGGGRDFTPGRKMLGLLPAGAYMVECVFVRRWDPKQNAATNDSDILISGFGDLADSAALAKTWDNLKSKLGLQATDLGGLHVAEMQGFSAGYRDGENRIAFAYWMANKHWVIKNVAGSTLRPFVTTIVCGAKRC